ncbi:hypothetical protein [Paraglaciecola sp.]|uniref:HzsA-related protein n=1 Tax=Paraglaciecola sp. TaxID=1920173 RepID=UPI0032638868
MFRVALDRQYLLNTDTDILVISDIGWGHSGWLYYLEAFTSMHLETQNYGPTIYNISKRMYLNIVSCMFRCSLYLRLKAVCLCLFLSLLGCGDDSILLTEQEADPVVVDVPIAYIKRKAPFDDEQLLVEQSITRPADFLPGASLYLKNRAAVSASEINISAAAFFSEEQIVANDPLLDTYDVKDLNVSYDGERLIFAMRAPEIEDADDDEQPTWNIWEYDVSSDSLRRIIVSDLDAEFGEDTSPVYLPDGRIVFSSTRQQANQAILLDEGKPQYQAIDEDRNQIASVLHVMDANGENIQQVSFNQSHDLDPTILSSGKILFSRWDNAVTNNTVNLYQMNTDGSGLEIVYGRHSHTSSRSDEALHFTQLAEQPDGQILAMLRPFSTNQWGADFINIDVANYIDDTMPIASQAGLIGPAQTPAIFDNVLINGDISPGGSFSAMYPLWDGSERILFSWSQCRVYDPEQDGGTDEELQILPCDDTLLENPVVEAAPLLYGLWMYDPIDNTQLVINVPEEGLFYTDLVAMQPRAFPGNALFADEYDQDLALEGLGRVHIRSVYDFAGIDTSPQGITALSDPTQTPVVDRPARFLRVVKAVSLPDDEVRDFDNSAFGRSRAQLMREIIGYVPIEPDGSALFNVPANVPLSFSVLDQDGQRVSERHQNWLQFAPGEVKTCNGCHTQNSEMPHGRLDAEADSINQGAMSSGGAFSNANPALFTDVGDTMAQTAVRILGVNYPTADIVFEDIWADPDIQAPVTSFSYAYSDLQSTLPISSSCALVWTSLCRIEINFPDHIQPIFSLDRQVYSEDGMTVLEDQTCVSCHTPDGADGLAQVPAAQLDLRGLPSTDDPDIFTSYRELLFTDSEQELSDGVLVNRLVEVTDNAGNIVYEVDEDGELVLDVEGNPIAVTATVSVTNTMSTNGAISSSRFFSVFDEGAIHDSWLTPAERKLLSEWLDIGAQYYNNPFTAPVN